MGKKKDAVGGTSSVAADNDIFTNEKSLKPAVVRRFRDFFVARKGLEPLTFGL